MDIDFEQWLSNTGRAQDVLQTIYEINEFSKGEYSGFFQNCGLYAVGSSLTQRNPNDIDIVLVGLDFRAIASYNKIFLQDPETLIAKEIVIDPALARQQGVVSPFCFSVGQNGRQSLAHSLPDSPNNRIETKQGQIKRIGDGTTLEGEIVKSDRLEDLEGIHQIMLAGIEYEGKYWAYNFQKGNNFESAGLNLDNYCLRQAHVSRLVNDFYEFVSSAFGQNQDVCRINTPFEPYFHDEEYFLTCRFSVHEDLCPSRKIIPERNCDCRPIDFMIHAENLHPKYWKEHQRSLNYPFIVLHEWQNVNETGRRPILTDLNQPKFIDPNGKDRVTWHPYFMYLMDAPINI